tara:strand:- start:374 stop:1705 length:1332 start_codon:yes stop_codon:yes gene_type:complete
MMNTTSETVEHLQSRAPAFSASDFAYLQEHMDSEELFPEVSDPIRRSQITTSLLAIGEMIPTLWTLLRDIRYFKQPARALQALLPPRPRKSQGRKSQGKKKETPRQRFLSHFTQQDPSGSMVEVQTSASNFTTVPLNGMDAFEVSYQQLWLCCCRIAKVRNPYGSLQLATLASRLGFSNSAIERELRRDPAHTIVQNAAIEVFSVLRPNEAFVFDVNHARPAVTSLKTYFNDILGTPVTVETPFITVAGAGEPLTLRCGRGSTDFQDLSHLFIGKIHAPMMGYHTSGKELSSFFVKRSRHLTFFRALDFNMNRSDMSTAPAEAIRPVQISVPPSQPTSLTTPGEEVVPETAYRHHDRAGSVVRFIQDATIQEVPYEKESVSNQARGYANDGKSLSLIDGGNFLWQACFDILVRTGQSTVIVSNATRVLGKRGRDQYEEDSRIE